MVPNRPIIIDGSCVNVMCSSILRMRTSAFTVRIQMSLLVSHGISLTQSNKSPLKSRMSRRVSGAGSPPYLLHDGAVAPHTL